MAQTNPPGRFDYLFEDLTEPDDDVGYDGNRLDAYAREPVPWHRTTPAMLAMVAITAAVVAIVVCAVLLVSRQSHGPGDTPAPSLTSTAPTTTATAPETSAAPPPPPPPASSPPQPTDTASAVIVPTNPPRPPAKPPETGGIRTPITRSPISVQPAPHRAFPHY